MLFGGDTIYGGLAPGVFMPLSVRRLRRSVEKIRGLEFGIILNGHHDEPILREKYENRVHHLGKQLSPWFDLPKSD